MHAFIRFALIAPAAAYTVTVLDQFMYKNVDPIVFPGQYNKSHLHTFFGSDAVTLNTKTSAELQAGCSTAENPNDFSAYWVPTLLYTTNSGSTWNPVPISRFSAYYNLGATPAEIAIPQNFKVKAGLAEAQTPNAMDSKAQVEWFCEGDSAPANKNKAAFPTSTCSTHLQTILYFPDCVDESTLQSAYKDRSYGTNTWCPSNMKRIPQLRFSIRYDLRHALPNGWNGEAPLKLACGASFCSHGDFINGWLPEAAKNMVGTTADKHKYSSVSGPNGDESAGSICKTTPKDADPNHGTSDYAESVKAMNKSSSSKKKMRRGVRGV